MEVFAMDRGDMFVYHDYLYEVTDQFREETSQRWCKQVAFKMDGKWHGASKDAGDWFNWYHDTKLVTINVN